MTNHLAKVADLEFVGKDTIRKEAEKAIDEAISIFDEVNNSLFLGWKGRLALLMLETEFNHNV